MGADPVDPAALQAAILRWLDGAVTHGVLVTDADLVVQSCNRWLEAHTGRPAADVVGRSLFAAWPDLPRRGLDVFYREALAGQSAVVAQALHAYLLPVRARGGSGGFTHVPQSARIAPLLDGTRVIGTITVIEDVSERVMREAELRAQIQTSEAARDNAEAALRSKDEFLATLSHELRTPLNAVLGWTRILRSRPADPATVDRALEIIERNGVAQLHLIEDMLDMSRMVSGKLRLELTPVDLLPSALGAVDVVTPAARAKGVVIRTQMEHGLPLINGDSDRLQQVVWNLLSNAVKFTPAGGSVEARLASDGEHILLTVTDTGEGISAEFLPHVFERFRQADSSISRRHSGLGLGLALVRQLVELHGGRIAVTSPGPGQGSTFSVRFPVARPKPRSSGELASSGSNLPASMLAHLRVVVVEDDPAAREALRQELEQYGANVCAVSSTREALSVLAEAPSNRQKTVLVSDIGLPGEDGYVLMERVRRLDPAVGRPVGAIAITAYAGSDYRRRALAAGYLRHFVKPIDPPTLATAIAEVASGDDAPE